jgi:excisionase family DNA binding protein
VTIRDLKTHSTQYVTVGELAEYWSVSRRQIYKQLESGGLEAIRLGPRLYRIRTAVAAAFERAMVAFDEAGTDSSALAKHRVPERFAGRPLRARLR